MTSKNLTSEEEKMLDEAAQRLAEIFVALVDEQTISSNNDVTNMYGN